MRDQSPNVSRVMGALVIGVVVASLDGTTVATALPVIVKDLGGLDRLPLVITSYMLASTIALPFYGRWSDALGRKTLLLVAQALFIIGAGLASTSSSMDQLIAYRAVQGAGAGGFMVLAQAVIGDLVPPHARSGYLGWLGALFASGSVAGPLIGGLLADNLGWEWVFVFPIPVGLIGLVATAMLVPNSSVRARVNPDLWGSALLSVSLASLVLVATWAGSTHAWTSPTILVLVLVFAGSTIGLIHVERGQVDGVLPIDFLTQRGVAAGMAVAMVSGGTVFGFIVFTPVLAQLGMGASATTSGFVVIPLMVSFMISSVLVGRSIDRRGRYRVFPIVGTSLIAVSFFLLATAGARTSLAALGAYLVIGGVGVSMVMQVVVLAMQTTVAQSRVGLATSMAQLFRSIGGVLGIAVLGSLLSARLLAELSGTGIETSGYTAAMIVENPGVVSELGAGLQLAVREAATASVTFVFALSGAVTVVALAAAVRLPDNRLKEVQDA